MVAAATEVCGPAATAAKGATYLHPFVSHPFSPREAARRMLAADRMERRAQRRAKKRLRKQLRVEELRLEVLRAEERREKRERAVQGGRAKPLTGVAVPALAPAATPLSPAVVLTSRVNISRSPRVQPLLARCGFSCAPTALVHLGVPTPVALSVLSACMWGNQEVCLPSLATLWQAIKACGVLVAGVIAISNGCVSGALCVAPPAAGGEAGTCRGAVLMVVVGPHLSHCVVLPAGSPEAAVAARMLRRSRASPALASGVRNLSTLLGGFIPDLIAAPAAAAQELTKNGVAAGRMRAAEADAKQKKNDRKMRALADARRIQKQREDDFHRFTTDSDFRAQLLSEADAKAVPLMLKRCPLHSAPVPSASLSSTSSGDAPTAADCGSTHHVNRLLNLPFVLLVVALLCFGWYGAWENGATTQHTGGSFSPPKTPPYPLTPPPPPHLLQASPWTPPYPPAALRALRLSTRSFPCRGCGC